MLIVWRFFDPRVPAMRADKRADDPAVHDGGIQGYRARFFTVGTDDRVHGLIRSGRDRDDSGGYNRYRLSLWCRPHARPSRSCSRHSSDGVQRFRRVSPSRGERDRVWCSEDRPLYRAYRTPDRTAEAGCLQGFTSWVFVNGPITRFETALVRGRSSELRQWTGSASAGTGFGIRA
jgi:hypothetical protein